MFTHQWLQQELLSLWLWKGPYLEVGPYCLQLSYNEIIRVGANPIWLRPSIQERCGCLDRHIRRLHAKRQAEVRAMLRNTPDYHQTDLLDSETHVCGWSHTIWILCDSSPSGQSKLTRNERRWRPQKKFHNHSCGKSNVLIPPAKDRCLPSAYPQQQAEDTLEGERDTRLSETLVATLSFLHPIKENSLLPAPSMTVLAYSHHSKCMVNTWTVK